MAMKTVVVSCESHDQSLSTSVPMLMMILQMIVTIISSYQPLSVIRKVSGQGGREHLKVFQVRSGIDPRSCVEFAREFPFMVIFHHQNTPEWDILIYTPHGL